ncbi:MAG: 2Fe-2S iron-sulfur cluster-binding protein [bacterium]|nr:2Fe-2S iron-sulfur cluster-binding protein [bacterium]
MTDQYRIKSHPILDVPKRREIPFTFNGEPFDAYDGEVISSALFANGIHIFGHHPKDSAEARREFPRRSSWDAWALKLS